MGAGWHKGAMGTVPTGTVTGCLLCQARFTSVDSSLLPTTTLGSVHHHPPPLHMLLESQSSGPNWFSWKPSTGSHHTLPLWWWSSVTLVPGQRLLSAYLHTTQQTRGCP